MMKSFGDYLSESLAAELTQEPQPTSSTAKQARKMNLSYAGFGRYSDQTGSITYVVKNNKLVPFRGKEEVTKLSQSSKDSFGGVKDEKQAQLATAVDASNAALGEVEARAKKYKKSKDREVQLLDKELSNFYKPELFTPEELESIEYYTEFGFGPINRYLYKGFDNDITVEEAQTLLSHVEDIDNAFEETEAPFDYIVYTGLSERYDYAKILPNNDYIFRGYISTSIDHNTATDLFMFTNTTDANKVGVLLEISIKKGQKSIYLEGVSGFSAEKETLLPRGSKIKVESGPHTVDHSTLSGPYSTNSIALFKCSIVDE
jgi:hypothetical protein